MFRSPNHTNAEPNSASGLQGSNNGPDNSSNLSNANVNLLLNDAQMEVCATSLKLPSFWMNHPEAWFIHIETLFNAKRISTDNTKYEYLIISLPQEIIISVIDIIQNPPTENRYVYLKNKLLERHSLSEQKKLDKLLSDTEIGDRKPSEFYRSLIQLAGHNINSGFLKNLWLRKLPRMLNIALMGSNVANIDDLLNLADNIWEVSNKPELCVVDSYPSNQNQSETNKVLDNLVKITSAMCEQFNKLPMDMSEIRQTLYEQSSNPSYRNRSKSRGRSTKRNWLCRFHYRFGSKARRCEDPCAFVKRFPEN